MQQTKDGGGEDSAGVKQSKALSPAGEDPACI